MSAHDFPWEMNKWLVGLAGHYYPWPEFAPEPDEYVHVLSRERAEEEPIGQGGSPAEQRPEELRLTEHGEWLNAIDRSHWEDGDRAVFAWMPRGGDRVDYYRQKFGGSYREIVAARREV